LAVRALVPFEAEARSTDDIPDLDAMVAHLRDAKRAAGLGLGGRHMPALGLKLG